VWVKVVPFSAALMAAAVPAICTEPVPLPVTVTPAVEPSVSVPLVTATVAVSEPLSMSATVRALPLADENTSPVSSVVDWAPGAVLTGASFTALTVTLTLAVSVTPPEVTV
jgi:hypothetical protein